MDPQDQNPADDQGGSTPADDGQAGTDQPMGGDQSQTPPSTEPPAQEEGVVSTPPPATEEPDAGAGNEEPGSAPSGEEPTAQ